MTNVSVYFSYISLRIAHFTDWLHTFSWMSVRWKGLFSRRCHYHSTLPRTNDLSRLQLIQLSKVFRVSPYIYLFISVNFYVHDQWNFVAFCYLYLTINKHNSCVKIVCALVYFVCVDLTPILFSKTHWIYARYILVVS